MQFSSRITWTLEQNRLAQLLARMPPRYDLTQSNPTAAGIEYPTDRIAAAFSDVRAIHYEPTPLGLPHVREAVSAYYNGAVPADRILLTASTSEAYSYLFKLLCDPGDEVLVPRPSYPLFEFLAHLECVKVKQYPMHYHEGWYIDTDAVRAAVTDRTRAIVYVNPNNPTGSFLKYHEYLQFASHNVPLIVDEVFSDYAFSQDGSRVTSTAAHNDVLTFTLSGLSKIAGLPQMKLGWIALSGPARDLGSAHARLELIADTFLSVGSPVQYAAPALLEIRHEIQDQIRSRTRANLEHLRSIVRRTAIQLLDVEAGWYATVQVPRIRSEEQWVLLLLQEKGVLVQPGFFYDFDAEAYLVLSLLTAPREFEEGVQQILDAVR